MTETIKQLVSLFEDHTFCFVCNGRLDLLQHDYDSVQLASGYNNHKWDGSMIFLVCDKCKRTQLEKLVAKTFKERFRPLDETWNDGSKRDSA